VEARRKNDEGWISRKVRSKEKRGREAAGVKNTGEVALVRASTWPKKENPERQESRQRLSRGKNALLSGERSQSRGCRL